MRVTESPGGGVDVEWVRENGPPYLLGWHVERQLPDGSPLRLTGERVEFGLFDPPATVYRFHDASASGRAGDLVSYRLVAVDPELREWPAPFAGQRIESVPAEAKPEKKSVAPSAKAAVDSSPSTTGQWVRIVVTNDGLYRLTAAQLAAVLTGTNSTQVAQSIAKTNFSLTCGGTSVAWRAESGGAALVFFGQAYRDTYADQNVYWLKPGRGLAMGATNRTTGRVAIDPWFWETVRAENNVAFMPYLPGGVSDDYFVWTGRQLVSPSSSWQWTTNVSLMDRHPGVRSGTVTAYLASGYNGTPDLDNRTLLSANGEQISDRSWAGDERLVQSGTASGLDSDSTAVTIEMRRRADVTTTMVLVDALEVRYARRMRAQNNQLLFRTRSGTNTVTVRGFTSSAIRVFDVSSPLRPVAVTPSIAQEGATWRASWAVDPASPRRFLAVARTLPPGRIDGVNDRGWNGAKSGAPHLVIAPKALRSTASVLVAHRREQGLNSILVPLEELYDAFSFGRRDPRAIQRFLIHAQTHWTVKPLYVCLAGDGHLDYHDYFGQSQTRPNHVPPILDRIPYDAQANGVLVTLGLDNPMADTDGDGKPEVVIGRLPAQTPAALSKMISRIVAHEASNSWKNRILMVSDKDGADSFMEVSSRLARRVPPGMTVQKLGHTLSTPTETMRADFIQAMNSGPAMALYYGHANNIGISSPYFFEHSFLRSNMSSLTNAPRAPVLIAGTCMLNDFAAPHPQNRCLGKGFLDTAPGGAVAVWASSAEATLGLAESMSGAILDKLFSAKTHRLGDLLRPALEIQAAGISPWTVRTSVLLGDPGMRFRTHLALDNTRPAIRITQPLPAASYKTYTNRMDLAGTASDLNGITKVVIRNDRSAYEYTASGTTNWRRRGLPLNEGLNRISAVAYDSAGNSATARLQIVYWVHHKNNSGGGALADGWQADKGWKTSAEGGVRSTTASVANVGWVPQSVYRTRREGRWVSYFLNLPDGAYNIRFHFSEPSWTAARKRLFNVAVEGRTVLTDFDIFQSAGGKNRATRPVLANVAVRGGLLIQATASRGQALFNGIEVWPATAPVAWTMPVKINSGAGTLTGGWRGDVGWTTSADGGAGSTGAAIANTISWPQAMYQTRRQGQRVSYTLGIPDGTYNIRCHFAEPLRTAPGQRLFNLEVEGRTVLTNFDIFQSAGGKNRAVRRLFASVVVRGGLQIQASASVGPALLNGIEVWPSTVAKSSGLSSDTTSVQPSADSSATKVSSSTTISKSVADPWPRVEVRSDVSGWTPAPELMDGDIHTVWTGEAGASTWSIAVDFEEVIPLRSLDLLFADAPWDDFSVMGTEDMLEWVDLDQTAERPVPCRAIYIQLRENGSGSVPSIREVQWGEEAPF